MSDQPSPFQPVEPGQPGQPGQPSPAASPGAPQQPDVVAWGQGAPAADQPPRRRSRKAVGAGVAAGVVVVGLLATGGAIAASRLGGGGAQPDEVVPATALGYVGVDLDPSAGQKLDALRFVRKFPKASAHVGRDDDLREALFDSLTGGGGLRGSWATDVEPWLGQRAGLALLRPAAEGQDPVPVVVLAVTDGGKARAGLAKVAPQAACEQTDGFAVCAPRADAAAARSAVAAAERSSLADDATYTRDVAATGGGGIAHAWLDLGRLHEAAPDSLPGVGGLSSSALVGDSLTGRAAATLRFDGTALELSGAVSGSKAAQPTGSAPVGDLPAGTLAAVGIGTGGNYVATLFTTLKQQLAAAGGADQLDAQLQAVQQQYGLRLPGDLQSALGDHVTVALGAVTPTPQVALRVAGDGTSIAKWQRAVTTASNGAATLAAVPAGTDTVLSNDQAYAHQVAAGSGLGSSAAFRAAVPHASDASSVLYVDVHGLVQQLGAQVPADTASGLAPLGAFGASARSTGGTTAFTARLTTR